MGVVVGLAVLGAACGSDTEDAAAPSSTGAAAEPAADAPSGDNPYDRSEFPEAEGGWYLKQFVVSNFVNNTDTFQVRFTAQDLGQFSVVEAAVDGVQIVTVICDECTSDLDGSGAVDFGDILEVLAAWGPCAKGCPEDLDGSGSVDFGDIIAILSAWGNGGGLEDVDGSCTVDFGDILVVLSAWGPCE